MNLPLALRLARTLAGTLLIAQAVAAEPVANSLTPEETAAGWRLLFDGQTTEGWRTFKKASAPTNGWVVADGCLQLARTGGGDIVSTAEFEEFELAFDWKVAPGVNSGLKYFVSSNRPNALGHEYQLLDDAAAPERRNDIHRTGTFYDVLPLRTFAAPKPAGEFNHSRVVVTGNRVEHWLNGVNVLTYELGSPEVKAAVAKSKFKDLAGFGTRTRGYILLQDHGGEVAFRNLKIRGK